MSISCVCPGCGKQLKAADSAAGKKAKCPDCGGAVPIPVPKRPVKKAAPVDDEFDLQSLDVDAGMAGPIEDEQRECPMCGEMIKVAAIKCRYCGEEFGSSGKKKKKRGRSSSGMPGAVIAAVVIEFLFLALNLLGVVGNLMQSNVGGAAGSGVRIAIEISIIVGFFQRKNTSRTSALTLSVIGIVFMIICGGILLAVGSQLEGMAQFQDGGMVGIIIGVLAVQTVLYIGEIIALMQQSAIEWLSE
jgi:hypothetical protein